ncbi:phage holin family protein [Ruegeria profundi]|uniref:phage holin family protein n=1 Tax=Ruegeria profundi TaxID=1685378 RepID=UPI001CD5620A|nr:phage holin family protein [Ruegeria profundi]MCA0928379.1 phage holin family protein [Ruegeria profundi]
MSRISRNISIILRAERLIAQRHIAVAARRTGFFAAAGLAVGLAVIMLNVAGFFWLSASLSKPLAALIMAGVNLLLALVLALLANMQDAQADTTAAVELRDMALQDIETEIKDTLSDARNTVTGIRRDPLGILTPDVISAVLGILIKFAKRKKDKPDP